MSEASLYPYAQGRLLHDRNSYFYSTYKGHAFLDAWARQRANAGISAPARNDVISCETPAMALIRSVREGLKANASDESLWSEMDCLVQRFEVTKRVHHEYKPNWRAVDPTQFNAADAYVELADAFCDAYRLSGQLPYLNALLKILDTLTSFMGDLAPSLRDRVSRQISLEVSFVEELQERLVKRDRLDQPKLTKIVHTDAAPIRSVLLASDTARSRAYLQAMCHFGCPPSEVFLMGPEAPKPPFGETEGRVWKGLYLPCLTVPISAICAGENIPITALPERDVNAPSTCEALACVDANLAVYSGVGGQIVSERALSAGPRFLHMHSGWLPNYRGSTTVYYSLLNNALPGVSAIFLDPGIDTGPIVARRHYPTPYAGMDVDLVYDTAIRADLLCRVLASGTGTQFFEGNISQSVIEGRTYYVIHPVLKHIAMLSLEGEQV